MEIFEIGKLSAQIIINGLFVALIFWFLTKYMPKQREDFLKALEEERTLHKNINDTLMEANSKLQESIKDIAQEVTIQGTALNRLITVLIAQSTNNGKEVVRLAENILNGEAAD